MIRSLFTGRAVLFLIILVLLTAPLPARPEKAFPLNQDFILFMAGIILVLLVYSIKTRSLIWPLWKGLLKQARWLAAAHIVLFLSCFLIGAKILIGGSIAWQIPLPLFVFGTILLIPGVYHQREMDPDKYKSRILRNSLLSMAIGFLLIPGFVLVYYLTLALTAFIRN